MKKEFWNLKRGDRVEYSSPHGRLLKGRVVFSPASNGGVCVVNLGGKYGTPGVFGESEFERKVSRS